jgi:hypothetical protein
VTNQRSRDQNGSKNWRESCVRKQLSISR